MASCGVWDAPEGLEGGSGCPPTASSMDLRPSLCSTRSGPHRGGLSGTAGEGQTTLHVDVADRLDPSPEVRVEDLFHVSQCRWWIPLEVPHVFAVVVHHGQREAIVPSLDALEHPFVARRESAVRSVRRRPQGWPDVAASLPHLPLELAYLHGVLLPVLVRVSRARRRPRGLGPPSPRARSR